MSSRGISVNITAQDGGTINTPLLFGNTITGAVNINGPAGHGHQSPGTTETDTAQKPERCKNGAEFVEKHRSELIKRVSLVEPIADDMKLLIGDAKYQIILKAETTHEQMRKLLSFLTTPELKEELYQSLVEHEHSVVKYLEGSG